MTITVLVTGVRHRVRLRRAGDPRIVVTACGETVAATAEVFDLTSAYQRAVYPLAVHPVPCPRCPS